MSNKKILVSGMQPSGALHIGNYFGALKQWVDLQDKYECRFFVANLHAMTTMSDPKKLSEYTRNLVLDYLGAGLDPEKVTIFLQSDIPHVAELAWVFECLVTVPYLSRAHAFKDAEVKKKDVNVGTFNYPILMAADILVHDAGLVPVGSDQKQHVEIAGDVADKFNNAYGETFVRPEPLIIEGVGTIIGTDGQKMSKSYGNTIPLFATDAEIEKAVMGIVTDSGTDIPKNVYELHKLFRSEDELKKVYEENKGKYKVLKEELIKDIKAVINPMRERRAEWEKKSDEVDKIIKEGGERMRKVVHEKMIEVRKKVGLIHHE
ncbi:MAG: tryptophan--tRNA ligase [Minisyncoccota bacterium]